MGVEINISGKTKLVGLVGSPVEHSMSPVMHTDSFKQVGVDAVYVAFDVTPDKLGEVVKGLADIGAVGYNVTMPDKTVVGQYLDELSPAAELMGAVNTVVIKDGKSIGHNTDGAGFVENLRHHGFDPEGKVVTIVGAGGAGSAIFTQLALDGVAAINVFNLKDDFWEATKDRVVELSHKTGVPMVLNDLDNKEQLARCVKNSSLFINATRVGMPPLDDQCTIDEDMLHDGLFVADTVYDPRETKLIKMAKKHGLETAPGIEMLLQQAALGEKLWFDVDMPVDYIEKTYF
jgi:shikimate dehydrogenase